MRMGVDEDDQDVFDEDDDEPPCERSAGTFWTWLCLRLPWSCTSAVGKMPRVPDVDQLHMHTHMCVYMCHSSSFMIRV